MVAYGTIRLGKQQNKGESIQHASGPKRDDRAHMVKRFQIIFPCSDAALGRLNGLQHTTLDRVCRDFAVWTQQEDYSDFVIQACRQAARFDVKCDHIDSNLHKEKRGFAPSLLHDVLLDADLAGRLALLRARRLRDLAAADAQDADLAIPCPM